MESGSTVKYKTEKISKNLTSIAKTAVTCTDEKGIINLRFPQTQKLKLCSAFFVFLLVHCLPR